MAEPRRYLSAEEIFQKYAKQQQTLAEAVSTADASIKKRLNEFYEELKPHDMVNHPPHYAFGAHETIDVIEAWELPYHLGNVIKYVSRAKRKGKELEDLKKAAWYLNRYITMIESKTGGSFEPDEFYVGDIPEERPIKLKDVFENNPDQLRML